MFAKLRNFNSTSHHDENEDDTSKYTYPDRCGKYKINKIRDLTVGVIVDFENGGVRTKPLFPSSRSSQMITFYFDNGCIMTIRTSGTEPKIKWYTEIRQLDKSK
jgi:phosphomannomutase